MKEKLLKIYSGNEAEIIADWTFEYFFCLSKMEIRLNKEMEIPAKISNQLFINNYVLIAVTRLYAKMVLRGLVD